MGEAKRRGSFEQRRSEAVAKAEAKRAELQEKWNQEALARSQQRAQIEAIRPRGKSVFSSPRLFAAAIIAASYAAKAREPS